jgi:hypothetical protein
MRVHRYILLGEGKDGKSRHTTLTDNDNLSRLSTQQCPLKASSRRVSLAIPDSVVPFSKVISNIYRDVLSVWSGKMRAAGLKVILDYHMSRACRS